MRRLAIPVLLAAGTLMALRSSRALAVDGVVEINQARALNGGVTPGDTPGFPVTISVAGSYRLTSNLTLPDANTDGIDITADNVSIDLNGFAVLGPVTCTGGPPVTSCTAVTGAGVGISSASSGTTVVNGKVQGAGGLGIGLGTAAHVSGVTVRWARTGGLVVGNESVVSGCKLIENGLAGITLGNGSVASGNVVLGNLQVGISGSGGNTLTANSVTQNGSLGIFLSNIGAGSVVIGNSITGNNGFGLGCFGPGNGYGQNVLYNNGGSASGVYGCAQLGTGTNLCNGVACP